MSLQRCLQEELYIEWDTFIPGMIRFNLQYLLSRHLSSSRYDKFQLAIKTFNLQYLLSRHL